MWLMRSIVGNSARANHRQEDTSDVGEKYSIGEQLKTGTCFTRYQVFFVYFFLFQIVLEGTQGRGIPRVVAVRKLGRKPMIRCPRVHRYKLDMW